MIDGRRNGRILDRLDQAGVTIVEVLIVLAVISLVFTITFQVFEPFFRQESFRQSVNLLTADINDILNDVRTGVSVDRQGVGCGEDGDDIEIIRNTGDSSLQLGGSDSCIMLGKAVPLGLDGTDVTEPDNRYEVHVLAGLSRLNAGSFERVELFNRPPPDEFVSSREKIVPQGGDIKMAYLDADSDGEYDPGETFVDGFAVVIASFGEFRGAGGFVGGSRSIALRAAYTAGPAADDGSRARLSRAQFGANTKSHRRTSAVFYHPVENPIVICLESGAGKQGLIRVGNQNGSLQALADLDPAAAERACLL